jgi:hypothetical protein
MFLNLDRVRILEKEVILLSDNTSTAYIVQSMRDLRSDVQDFKNELNVGIFCFPFGC